MRGPSAGFGYNLILGSILAFLVIATIFTDTVSARSRFQFHEQGLKGPHSYRFGFDTGEGHNRMTRHEEKDDQGVVHGYYTYHDPKGNLRTVYYEAHPKYGFHVKGDFGNFPGNGNDADQHH